MKLSELLNFDQITLEDQSLKENGIESTNALANMGIFIIIIAFVVVVMIILVLVAKFS